MNDQLRSFLWMIFAVILLVGILKESPTDKTQPGPTPLPTPTATPTPSPTPSGHTLAVEKAIVKILLSHEAREKFCSKVEVQMDADKPEQVRCQQKNGWQINYSTVAETSLTIELQDGTVVSDTTIDGNVDFGTNKDGTLMFYRNTPMRTVRGEENFLHWQNEWEKLMDQIDKDLELLQLKVFIY